MAYRNTRQRQLILDELRKLKSHPTATMLYDIVRRRLPTISLGTVYRNLEQMAAAGLVRKIETSGSAARYDGSVHQHDHIRCVRCGRVDDLPAMPLDKIIPAGQDWGGYRVLDRRVEFLGLCPECQKAVAHSPQGLDLADRN